MSQELALTAELLSQGGELLNGDIADTNGAWLAAQLDTLGFHLQRISTVGDCDKDIAQVLTEIAGRSRLCLCTGGLGPTQDDYTAEAVAQAFSRPLQQNSEAVARITGHYAKLEIAMPAVNLKQSYLPQGAEYIDNAWGTAPGFAVWEKDTWFVFLPGVPTEMQAMYQQRIVPRIITHFAPTPGRNIVLRTVGLGESNLQEKVGSFHHPYLRLGYRSVPPEVQIKLMVPAQVSEAEWRKILASLQARIGEAVFSIEGLPEGGDGNMAQVVGRLLLSRGECMALAESCTGGLLAHWCTALAGASAWFSEGVVSYSNAAKIRSLGVQDKTLQQQGAVSSQTASEMAAGIKKGSAATYGLAITGVAGPGGGTEAKPVGTVYIALATPTGVLHRRLALQGDRRHIQMKSAMATLDLLRQHLLSISEKP